MLHFIVVKMVVGPIRQLESAIRKADAGDFNAVVPYKAADEIGSLVTSYQKMLHTITDKAEEVRFQNTEIERQKRIMEVQAQYLERANASLRQNNTDLRQFMQREFLRVEELTRHKDTLIGIAREEAIYNGDMKKAFERITELGSLHLDVARVSIWLFRNGRGFVGTPQIHELELIDLYDNTNQIHTESARLKAEDYPHYFSALESMELIHASDAVNDERTSEFTENYLKPLGIGAMLDVPIRDGNIVVGVLCAEHVGSTRLWTIEEQIFARSLAGFVTTALDAREKLRQRERMADLNKELLLTNTDIQEKNIALQNAQDAAAQTLLYINHQNKLLETKTKELAEANEHLQDKQRLLTEINELLDDAHKQLNQQNELLKGKNEEATLNVLSLKDQNSALRLTHEELQAAYAEIKRQHEILEQQSRQAAAMTEEVQSKNALLLDANTELSGVYRELRRQNELLQEQAVTIEVANTELQEKNLRLVQIDQEKNDMLGIVAHDLRNPLSSIMLGAAFLKRLHERGQLTSEDMLRHLSRMEDTADRMNTIITELLDLNALETGKMQIHSVDLDMSGLVQVVADDFTKRAEAKNIGIYTKIPEASTRLITDGRIMRQILDNLVSNAVKFSPQKTSVVIELERVSERLLVRVRDEGPGISAKDRALLFLEFKL